MFINLILHSAFPFSTTGSWDLFAIKSAAVFGLVFFQVNHNNGLICKIQQERHIKWIFTTEKSEIQGVRYFTCIADNKLGNK